MIKTEVIKLYVPLLFLLTLGTKISANAQQSEQSFIKIKVEGEVTQSLKLNLSDLEKMKRVTVMHKGHDSVASSYTGVPLIEILYKAGVTLGKELRGKNLAKYLLVTAADGYQVVFSLAEIDPDLNDKQIILADKMNGKPMVPNQGPFKLIVPGEKRPSRSVREVVSFVIKSAM